MLLWLLKWTIGPIIALIVTLVFSEPLKNRLAPLIGRFGSKNEDGFTGNWLATFSYGPSAEAYTEAIQLSSFLGQVVGRIIPHPQNHQRLRAIEKSAPLRLRGSIKDNRYFTGVWFHPLRRSHYHGAFELLIDQNGEHMQGMWVGYSESKNLIENGEWTWERID
jgi:hypothetical protein